MSVVKSQHLRSLSFFPMNSAVPSTIGNPTGYLMYYVFSEWNAALASGIIEKETAIYTSTPIAFPTIFVI